MEWLLDKIRLQPGSEVVELGCGHQGSLDLLADRVGPTGHVIGVERLALAVAQARRLVLDRGLVNVEIIHADARHTKLPRETFDLVTARMVLLTGPRPEEIIAAAFALARPGGVIAFHEADFVSHVCDPPLWAWTRLIDVLEQYGRLTGMDLHMARRLPRLLRDAGVVDVQTNPRIFIYPPGHGQRTGLLEFVTKMSHRILAERIIEPEELADLKRALAQHVADPETMIVSHLFLQAWGQKPQTVPLKRSAEA